jgi:predicted transcriptional regulator
MNMANETNVDLHKVREKIKEIKSAPLAEHSQRFAEVNQELAKKMQEIESN